MLAAFVTFVGVSNSGEQVRRFTDRDLDPVENTRSDCSVLLFTPDGRLVVGTEDGRVVAFDADSGKVTARFKADGFYTWDLGVAPAGRYVAGFDTEHKLAVWDLDSGEKVFTGPTCEGKSVFWSRHGSCSASERAPAIPLPWHCCAVRPSGPARTVPREY